MAWDDEALCRTDADPDAWFAEPWDHARRAHAVDICLQCPIRHECLQRALADKAPGTWGATSAEERRLIRRAGRLEGANA